MRYSAIRNLVVSNLRSFMTNDRRKQLDVQLKEKKWTLL